MSDDDNHVQPVLIARRHTASRVFISLWLIFCTHWATDFVREHFLVVGIVDRHTFALDGFEDLHPDIFVHDDGHSYLNANPGVSMLGAIPYFVLSPVVDLVVERELASRGEVEGAAVYDDPRPARREFYGRARARGLDVRFGLVGLVTMVFAMAPLSALGGTIFFQLLIGSGLSRRIALGGTVLYALGTPVFMRTAYLNQNVVIAIFGLIGFGLLWNPGDWSGLSRRARWFGAGLCGGLALLCDYSGGLMLGLLGLYGILGVRREDAWTGALRESVWYVAGAAGPVLLLWYYQWSAFGFPFYPPQHYMPAVEWSDLGYQGVTTPQADLFRMLLLDSRFGLFVNAPAVLLALAAPFLVWRGKSYLPARETIFALAVALSYVLFFSMVQYTRLEYITGMRYLVPTLPFLVLAAIAVLLRLPRALSYGIVFVSVLINWGLAMGRPRTQESLLMTLARVYLEGFQLPALSTLSRMSAQYLPVDSRLSAAFVLLALAVVLVAVWTIESPGTSLASDEPVGSGGAGQG